MQSLAAEPTTSTVELPRSIESRGGPGAAQERSTAVEEADAVAPVTSPPAAEPKAAAPAEVPALLPPFWARGMVLESHAKQLQDASRVQSVAAWPNLTLFSTA